MSNENQATEDLMRYDLLAQHALRSVVKLALQRVVRDGNQLPGEHHFFISFDTSLEGVSVSDRIKQKYPEDMTIVLQHQFWNLEVFDHYFQVELSFDNITEKLVIPFAAIKGFFDPTVQFGLQFEAGILEEDDGVESAPALKEADKETSDLPAPESGNSNKKGAKPDKEDAATVVSLDAFRKK